MLDKPRLSYYDLDTRTANMYAPIDEYLQLTKRFGQKTVKRKYAAGIVIYALLMVLLGGAAVTLTIISSLFDGMIIGWILAIVILLFKAHLNHKGEEPHPDLLICEDIIDKDGMEKVYRDYSGAVQFTKNSVIGNDYVFIKGETIVRIKDIDRVEVEERYVDEDETRPFFTLCVKNEQGDIYGYYLEKLDKNKAKCEQRANELRSIIEARRKRLDLIDI